MMKHSAMSLLNRSRFLPSFGVSSKVLKKQWRVLPSLVFLQRATGGGIVPRCHQKKVRIGVESRPNSKDFRKLKTLEVWWCVGILNKG